MVRITTWNVNGIRNPFGYQPWSTNRTFNAMFDILEADIVIMQELKIQRKDLTDDMVLVPGWDCYFSLPKYKKGYSGVGIYTRQSVCAPIRAEEGLMGVLCPSGSSTPYCELPDDACIGGYPSLMQLADLGVDPTALDSEGRCLVIEFPAFVLFGLYMPANSSGERDDFQIGFHSALDARIRNLTKMGKNVIVTGDLNIHREEIDSARAEERMREEGWTRQEFLSQPIRRIFNQMLEGGKVFGARDENRENPVLWDICRSFHPKREGMFTHWEQKINARPGNFGSRIDYILCSISMKSWFSDSNIQEGLMGSDHCPVYASMKGIVDWQGQQVHIQDVINPSGMFKDGERLREIDLAKDVPLISGKRMPEFHNRRSIKDMFTRKPSLPSAKSTVTVGPSQVETIEDAEVGASGLTSKSTPSTNKPVVPPSAVKSAGKRRASAISPAKPVKRTKSSLGVMSLQSSTKGQQSLRGFFAPKASVSKPEVIPESTPYGPTYVSQEIELSPTLTSSATHESSPPEPFIDPEASKESWTKLFSKKPSPRCEHGEPCKSFTTKKSGANNGRQFWLCARPLGPTGQKESGTQWRCPTFIWHSDWKGSG